MPFPSDLVIDDLPGPKRGQAPVLYFRDEIVWAPDGVHFALAYTIDEASMMNDVGCVFWGSFDGHTTTKLGNPIGIKACCWKSPWCNWIDAQTFVFKAQYYDKTMNTLFVPLVALNLTQGFAVLPGTNNVNSGPSNVTTFNGPFESRLDELIQAIRNCN